VEGMLLYLRVFIKGAIKLTVVIIEGYHFHQNMQNVIQYSSFKVKSIRSRSYWRSSVL